MAPKRKTGGATETTPALQLQNANTLIKNLQHKLEHIVNNPQEKPQNNFPEDGAMPSGPSFVIITYWWGRGNHNKNLQYPCPEDLGTEETLEDYVGKPRYKPREKFETMIDTWKANIQNKNCYYYVQEYPEFAKPGMYQMAINAKPLFIRKALEDCSARGFKGVVYIDGDMTVNQYPAIFDIPNIDFMARGWNIDPRSAAAFRKKEICFDPFIFETSGGIMYFGNTPYARQLLDIWKVSSGKPANKGKADDRIISLMFNALGLFIPYNIIQLPIEYLWLTDIYGEKELREHVKKGHVVYDYTTNAVTNKRMFDNAPTNASGAIVFEHPACLTGEERAADQGASSNRTPLFYNSLVEDKIECSRHGGVFYEYIYFYGADRSKLSYDKYLEYIGEAHLPDKPELPPFYVVPYDKGYGEHADIAKEHVQNLGGGIHTVLTAGLDKSNAEKSNANTHEYVTVQGLPNDAQSIEMILSNLMQGYDVMYLPEKYNVANSFPLTGGALTDEQQTFVEHLKQNVPVDCELVAFVDDTDAYQPEFKTDAPMYFSHRSTILRHLLLMCKTITPSDHTIQRNTISKTIQTGLTDVFRSSFIFITRIRCKWLDEVDA